MASNDKWPPDDAINDDFARRLAASVSTFTDQLATAARKTRRSSTAETSIMSLRQKMSATPGVVFLEWYACDQCDTAVGRGDNYCRGCGFLFVPPPPPPRELMTG